MSTSMHCPGCGNESSLDQKFCRQCGFNLEPVSKLMLSDAGTHKPEAGKTEGDKLIMQRMVSWMMWGMLALLIGIVIAVVGKQFVLDRLVSLIGTLFMLGGVSLATYGVLDAIRCGGAKSVNAKLAAADKSLDSDNATTTKQLEGRIPIPLASVTERTTQLIGAEDATQNPASKL